MELAQRQAMRGFLLGGLVVGLISFSSVPKGTAQDPIPEHAIERGRLSVDLQASFGGPKGLVGVGIGLAPIPYWVIEVGAGLSVPGMRGPARFQFGASTRGRIPLFNSFAIGPELVFSAGSNETPPLIIENHGHVFFYDTAVWFGGGLSAEVHYTDWLSLRLFAGYARNFSTPTRCVSSSEFIDPCDLAAPVDGPLPLADVDLLYIGVSLSFWILSDSADSN